MPNAPIEKVPTIRVTASRAASGTYVTIENLTTINGCEYADAVASIVNALKQDALERGLWDACLEVFSEQKIRECGEDD